MRETEADCHEPCKYNPMSNVPNVGRGRGKRESSLVHVLLNNWKKVLKIWFVKQKGQMIMHKIKGTGQVKYWFC